jgi:hypothetical protein
LKLTQAQQDDWYSDFLTTQRSVGERELALLVYVWGIQLGLGARRGRQIDTMNILGQRTTGSAAIYFETYAFGGAVQETLPMTEQRLIARNIRDLASEDYQTRTAAYNFLQGLEILPLDQLARYRYTTLEQRRRGIELIDAQYYASTALQNYAFNRVMARIMRHLTATQRQAAIEGLAERPVGNAFVDWAIKQSDSK